MELKEIYDECGGGFEEALTRFKTEEKLKRFIQLFLEDDSFSSLKEAVEKEKWDEAFRNVHTLKGVALNMSFKDLAKSSSDLTEQLRGGKPPEDIG